MNTALIQSRDYVKNIIAQKNRILPSIAVVLGSGMGTVVDDVSERIEIPYAQIPNAPISTVAGHAGKLIVGTKNNTPLMIFSGRRHYYEDGNVNNVAFFVRLMSALGIKIVVFTSACGGIRKNLAPGDLVMISDHINLTGTNVLIGANDEGIGPRFPDMTNAYDPELLKLFQKSGKQTHIDVKQGILAGLSGPSYETAAEIRMLSILGANVVTMSMVNEVIAARHAGLKVAGIAGITNMATGISTKPHSHEDVMKVANLLADKLNRLLIETLPKIV